MALDTMNNERARCLRQMDGARSSTHILEMSDRLEMSRIATLLRLAETIQFEAIWHIADEHHVRDAMRADRVLAPPE